jgi:acetylornithine deacetylase/succinyl-diaminopimelate desuccinylase-like protein
MYRLQYSMGHALVATVAVISVAMSCVIKPVSQPPILSAGCSARGEIDPPFDPDPSKLEPEQLLAAYLRVNTSQPEGCEGKAARFWKRFFDLYGIENEILPLPFGEDRASFIARVKHKSAKGASARPLILHHHLDVASFDSAKWGLPPFSGLIKDGYIYGRGAMGAKAAAVNQALAMVKASRFEWPLNRDLIFLGTANGEGLFNPEKGIISGVEWIIKNRRNILGRAEYIMTFGGVITTANGLQQRWEISTAEKSRLEITLTPSLSHVDASAGNIAVAQAASRMMSEFSRPLLIDVLEAADEDLEEDVQEIGSGPDDAAGRATVASRPALLTDPAVRANYETTHALTMLGGRGQRSAVPSEAFASLVFIGGAARRTALEAAVRRSMLPGVGVAEIRQVDGHLRMVVRSIGAASSAVTPPMNGGANTILVHSLARIFDRVSTREIPAKSVQLESLSSLAPNTERSKAEAIIDFRLLPNESLSRLMSDLKSMIFGLGVEMSVTSHPIVTRDSPTQTGLFDAIATAHARFTGAMPSRPALETPIMTHTTEATLFRQLGMITYGFDPLPIDAADLSSAANDERLAVTSIRFANAVTNAYLAEFLTRSPARTSARAARDF